MNKEMIDFRSDTVTKPTENMYKAMMSAPVGDDVYGDDPTINELENLAAEITGKEAAMFVPSGTFGNQVSIMTHVLPGNEIIAGSGSHIIQHECGSLAKLSGGMLREVDDRDGYMHVEDIDAKIRKTEDVHYPKTGLIEVEPAHSNGKCMPLSALKATKELAEKYDIPVHMDGARLFNAAAFLGVEASDLTRYCDSVTFCLSKGLCAPVGSVVCSTKEFIERARKNRKSMGGGLRQAGILAAAGIVGINEMRDGLKKDHENAVSLAKMLENNKALRVFTNNLDLNMVFTEFIGSDISSLESLPEKLKEEGIIINPAENNILRFVTHHPVTEDDCRKLSDLLGEYLR